jgi:hypothetical protein
VVFCETCGTDNTNQARYCKSCGATMESDRSPQRPSSPPPLRKNESIGFGSRSTGEDLVLKCSLCGRQDFARDRGRLDSKWGLTSFKVVMLTCRYCGHIELFSKGRSIWDFD